MCSAFFDKELKSFNKKAPEWGFIAESNVSAQKKLSEV